jgi:hypothetical protein
VIEEALAEPSSLREPVDVLGQETQIFEEVERLRQPRNC